VNSRKIVPGRQERKMLKFTLGVNPIAPAAKARFSILSAVMYSW
jgi:hypothetical protein